jgi:hypothetical protein
MTTKRPKLRRCGFIPSGWSDSRGVRICTVCGGLETHALHRVPEVTDEQRAADARRIGDR